MADDTTKPSEKPKGKPRESNRKEYTLKQAVILSGVRRNPGDKVLVRQVQAKRLHNQKII